MPDGPYRRLGSYPELTVGRYLCGGVHSSSVEATEEAEVVFVHRGAFRVETARGTATLDSGQLLQFERGEEYRVRHPLACRDQCLVLSLRAGALAGLAHDLEADAGIDPDRPFATLARVAEPELFLRSRFLRAALEDGREAQELREDAADLFVRVVGGGARGGLAPATGNRRRRARERVERVLILLAADPARRWTLEALASDVGCSSFYLAHLFRRSTGRSIRQHQIALRLRAAVDRLAAGERDLTRLALEAGFADHAHFSRAFRRHFGLTPSSARRRLRSGRTLAAPSERRREPEAGLTDLGGASRAS